MKGVEADKILGLIAGGGKFPHLVADSARKNGFRVVAVAHRGETEPSLSDLVDEINWIKLGQFGQLIGTLKKWGVKRALMAGTITKKKMFEIRPDLKGLALMSRLAMFHDDGILRAVTEEMAKEGIEIIAATSYIPELVAPQGCLTKRKPNRNEEADIAFGWRIAKRLGDLDIGQSVVVRKKTVLALEAIEGTDETIRRGGKLAREGAVVVKVSKPNQDLRFDMPTVGLKTVDVMAQVKAVVLAVESEKTLLIDRAEMIAYANRAGIVIVCYEDGHWNS